MTNHTHLPLRLRLRLLAALALCSSLMYACGPGGPPPCDAFCACTADVQCPTATPFCDVASGTCSVCVPTELSCPKDQLCVKQNNTYACSSTCLADTDCPKSDAGSAGACCKGACLDTQNDSSNCGACGTVCPMRAHGASICAGGQCVLGACEVGFGDCDKTVANGCEVDLTTSADNCSACAKACAKGANGTATCAASTCGIACGMGFANCDGDNTNGCETNTQTDGKNCGACGSLCGPLANASPVCTAGACNVMSCNMGYADCDTKPANGCEVNAQTDVMNCGACAKVCMLPNAVASCTSGACSVASCNAGFADCNKVAADGCETSLLVDGMNCGACGSICAGANATEACKAGACAVTACTKGYSDCDMNPKNGCEIRSDVDVLNCGACGLKCGAIVNGTAGCAAGVCGVGGCTAPFADCNKDAKDGCEADLTTPATCGACGIACMPLPNAVAACTNALCALGKCNPGFYDCDAMAANGCEINGNTDIKNCGACAKACAVANGTSGCAAGACTVATCNAGFGDCDKMAANGCELPLTADPKNCGACGNVCPNNLPACQAGVCVAQTLLTTVCGKAAPQVFAGGNCSFNTAQFADYWCQLGGFTKAVSYTTISAGNFQSLYYNGGNIALTNCNQVMGPASYGFNGSCTGVNNLYCQ